MVLQVLSTDNNLYWSAVHAVTTKSMSESAANLSWCAVADCQRASSLCNDTHERVGLMMASAWLFRLMISILQAQLPETWEQRRIQDTQRRSGPLNCSCATPCDCSAMERPRGPSFPCAYLYVLAPLMAVLPHIHTPPSIQEPETMPERITINVQTEREGDDADTDFAKLESGMTVDDKRFIGECPNPRA